MRCPKCHYIGFDSGERCRNCGYDFSLTDEAPAEAELPIRMPDSFGPPSDLPLGGDSDPPRRIYPEFDLDRIPKKTPAPPELPLFGEDRVIGGDAPIIAPPRAPRSPLSVRRATPDVVRLRSKSVRRKPDDEPALELTPTAPSRILVPQNADGDAESDVSEGYAVARSVDRFIAGFIDMLLLLAIDVAVVYFTVRLCELTYQELSLLPKAPLIGFIALLNGGYFVSFTAASGQTIGKMTRHIRVVDKLGSRLNAGQAILRTAAYCASALPFGLGFLAAIFGPEGRALHDRLADTRVVRVTAA